MSTIGFLSSVYIYVKISAQMVNYWTNQAGSLSTKNMLSTKKTHSTTKTTMSQHIVKDLYL